MATDFTINCTCGQQLHVKTVDAGGSKRCYCGAINAVPSLRELRRLAGQQSYDVGIADKLRQMFPDGELASDDSCVLCGAKTGNILPPSLPRKHPVWSIIRRIVGLFIAFGIGYSFDGCASKSQWGVSGASWMPPGSSDGAYGHGATFILGPANYFYEYTISESDFRKEAEQRGYSLSEITEPEYVTRYLWNHVRPNEYEGDEWEREKEFTSARITSGLIHEWRYIDQTYIFAYDRKKKRAYIHYQTR